MSKKTILPWRQGLPSDMCHLPPQLVVAGPAAITCGGTLGWPDGGGPAAAAPSGRKWSSTPVGLTRRRCASLCATCETGLGRWLLCRALECGAADGGVWSADVRCMLGWMWALCCCCVRCILGCGRMCCCRCEKGTRGQPSQGADRGCGGRAHSVRQRLMATTATGPAATSYGGKCHLLPGKRAATLRWSFLTILFPGGIFWQFIEPGGPLCQNFKFVLVMWTLEGYDRPCPQSNRRASQGKTISLWTLNEVFPHLVHSCDCYANKKLSSHKSLRHRHNTKANKHLQQL
jgi:hypothetical protein